MRTIITLSHSYRNRKRHPQELLAKAGSERGGFASASLGAKARRGLALAGFRVLRALAFLGLGFTEFRALGFRGWFREFCWSLGCGVLGSQIFGNRVWGLVRIGTVLGFCDFRLLTVEQFCVLWGWMV